MPSAIIPENKTSKFNTKLQKKKGSVKHATLGQSSLAERLEKTQAALAKMTEKYNAVISTSSDGQSHSSDETAGLVPKPQGEVGRSGKNQNKKGYHLQTAMGMMDRKDLYNKIHVSFLIFAKTSHI